MKPLIPVLLAGGGGSRLWPLSTCERPKALCALQDDTSQLVRTARRLARLPHAHAPLIVARACDAGMAQLHWQQARLGGCHWLFEPQMRNTAAACVVAALHAVARHTDALILVLPCDHAIADEIAWAQAVADAMPLAQMGKLVCFGMQMSEGITDLGYGYIVSGSPLGAGFEVSRFVEKPDTASAEALRAVGCTINSGMFLFPVAVLLSEIEQLEPDLFAAMREALQQAEQEQSACYLAQAGYERVFARSIDHALMEHTDKAAMVPLDCGWSDLGTFARLHAVASKDAEGNHTAGAATMMASRNNYVHSDRPVAMLGVEGLAVINTAEALLVMPHGMSEGLPALLEAVTNNATMHSRQIRPWGYFDTVHTQPGVQMKILTLTAGAKLSLQRHAHRAEHWVVLEGEAEVQLETHRHRLGVHESISVPIGAAHRLENAGAHTLRVLEIQTGAYLGEDDIERLADDFGRADSLHG